MNQFAKIAQSLQHNIDHYSLGFIVFLFKSLNLFNLTAAAKNLITNYTFFINYFVAEVPIISKLVHSFAEEINGLVTL